MKTTFNSLVFSLVTMGIITILAIGNSCKNEEAASAFKCEAIQYTIDQPDGTTIILQSRGTGHGTNKAFFDIYIEQGKGHVTAFRNDVWYSFGSVSVEESVSRSSDNASVSGHIVSIDSNYFLDINGGSDMGGVTYQFHTGSLQTMKNCLIQTSVSDTTPIEVNTETDGNIDAGTHGQWDNIYENSNGTLYWNGSKFVTNNTAAHAYFTNLRTGKKLKEHFITEIPTVPGTFGNIPGYIISKTVYTYTTPMNANGGISDLGVSFPVKFNIQFLDKNGTIQEIRFQPALVSENKQ